MDQLEQIKAWMKIHNSSTQFLRVRLNVPYVLENLRNVDLSPFGSMSLTEMGELFGYLLGSRDYQDNQQTYGMVIWPKRRIHNQAYPPEEVPEELGPCRRFLQWNVPFAALIPAPTETMEPLSEEDWKKHVILSRIKHTYRKSNLPFIRAWGQ